MIPIYSFPKDYYKIMRKVKVDFWQDFKFQEKIKTIIKEVKKNGDSAVKKLSYHFDKVKLKEIKVTPNEIKQSRVKKSLKDSLQVAIQNIKAFHQKQIISDVTFHGKFKEILKQVISPIEKVGVYVPGGVGGNTPLISTLLMNVIPAQIAGVKEINVCTPPQLDSKVNPSLLYTCQLLKIKNIFKIGGAQAIASLTYGTATVPPCDIIVGPGNEYVTYAKKLVYGDVQIDGLNGNSEIIILSDGSEKTSYLAADLLSQAEHAGNELIFLFTNKKDHALEVKKEISKQICYLTRQKEITSSLKKRGAIILVKNWLKTFDFINLIAPEHLEINLKNNQTALKKVKNAGTIFLGKYSSEPIGDYVCGTNHVLPTNQTARFASPLGVYTFLKRTNIIKYNREAFLHYQNSAIQLAQSEGLDAHANALKIRN